MSEFCPHGPGGQRRDALPQGAHRILKREATAAKGGSASQANASQSQRGGPLSRAPGPHAQQQQQQQPASAPAAQAASVPATATTTPSPVGACAAHAAAAAAAAACGDDSQAAGEAYVAAMRALGFGLCATALTAPLPSPHVQSPPSCSRLYQAMVDTMATFWVVNDPSLLVRVTNPSPGFTINTANGPVPVHSVGVALVCMLTHDGQWRCYEVSNVLVMPNCPDILYSTRVMKRLHGLTHDFDSGQIKLPSVRRQSASQVNIRDDGASYSITIAFATSDAPLARHVVPAPRVPVLQASFIGATFPASLAGTTQATLYQRLGFPDEHTWRHVPATTTGHGLPPKTVVSTTIPVRDAVMRGRARKLPFLIKPDKLMPAPGSTFYGDFAGPMIPSHPHRFIAYSGFVDAGSGYGRPFPVHGMTAIAASSTLDVFIADVAAKMGLTTLYKPSVVRTDQGSAYISQHFREFLSEKQIQQSLACTYTPQQNSHVERFWGLVFTLARVLLASANLPPSFHPFAVQTAAWITNRLPRSTRGNQSPIYLLSKREGDLSELYCFGCLCSATTPAAVRDGDKHFANRGEPALYLGPSEISPGHVVYLLSSRKVVTRAKIQVWEDQFPGIKGVQYVWFPEEHPPSQPSEGRPLTVTHDPAPMPSATSPAPATAPSAAPEVAPSSSSPPALPVPHGPELVDEAMDAPEEPVVAPADPPTVVPLALRREGRHRTRSVPDRMRSDVMGHSNITFFSRRPPALLPASAQLSALGLFAMAACGTSSLVLGAFAFASVLSSVDAAFTSYSSVDEDSIIDASALAATTPAVTITADFGDVKVPQGYKNATTCELASYWIAAIHLELQGLLANKTWTYVPLSQLPRGINIMRCHYVFAVKRNPDGSIEKFKARLVADGNTQKWGIDFDRIFSTVVKTCTLRLLLIIAAANDYNLSQVDIKQAYLQATVTEDLYMRVPEGLPNRDDQGRPLVCKLQRSLYGLRQAGREWGNCLSDYLVGYGFKRSTIDTCLYMLTRGDTFIWVAVYVDDILCVDNDSALRGRVVKDLNSRFSLSDKGDLHWLLGVEITRDRKARSISLSQALYVKDLITKFAPYIKAGFTRTMHAPMEEGFRLTKTDMPALDSTEYRDMAPFRPVYMSLVGGLIWVSTMTRHELAFAVSQLARVLTNPGRRHFDAAVRVLIYLQSTIDDTLFYKPNLSLPFETFVDSDWASSFSCSGAYFMLMGCPFHWFSKMQHSISLSSAEAEFFGAMLALKEVIFFRELLVVLKLLPKGPTVIHTDSQSAVALSLDHVLFKQSKHILRAAEFLRDSVARLVASLRHLPGRFMIADILTKSLARPTFIKIIQRIREYPVAGVAVAEEP